MSLEFVQLSVSEVKDKQLVVAGATPEAMQRIYQRLQADLFEGNIPHYRPIGVYIKGSVRTPETVINRVVGASKSYVEFWQTARDIVMGEPGGRLQHYQEAGDRFAFIHADTNATTSNGAFRFCCEGDRQASMLAKDIPVIELSDSASIKICLYRGTGLVDFKEAERILRMCITAGTADTTPMTQRFYAMRAVYNLYNDILLCPYAAEDGNTLRFMYKRSINEAVLTKIIQQYAQDLGGL